jgi:hypothetical protein
MILEQDPFTAWPRGTKHWLGTDDFAGMFFKDHLGSRVSSDQKASVFFGMLRTAME